MIVKYRSRYRFSRADDDRLATEFQHYRLPPAQPATGVHPRRVFFIAVHNFWLSLPNIYRHATASSALNRDAGQASAAWPVQSVVGALIDARATAGVG